jgi:hypothetical protein
MQKRKGKKPNQKQTIIIITMKTIINKKDTRNR